MDDRLARLSNHAAALFTQRFNNQPRWISAGPGRVNLIGEHVDYNDGFVLPMAIDRHIVIAAAPASDRTDAASFNPAISRLAAEGQSEPAIFSTSQTMQRGEPTWSNYVRGVIAGFQQRNIAVPAFDAMIVSDLPMGGGLSSSAALEMAMATLLEAMTFTHLSLTEKALLCQKAEHDFALVPCGIMDQFASAMGRRDHFLLIDCRSQQIRHVPMLDETIAVLIVNTNVRHELSDGGYALRRRQCEEAAAILNLPSLRDATMAQLDGASSRMQPVIYRRARHVISEISRTLVTANAAKAQDWGAVGSAMYESHASLRDDFEVSCKELDLLVDLAQSISAGEAGDELRDSIIGCRMTGGGFGGCVVSLVRKNVATKVAQEMARQYQAATKLIASHFITRPSEGAAIWPSAK